MSSLSDSFRKTLRRLVEEDRVLVAEGRAADECPEVADDEREDVLASLRLLAMDDVLRLAHAEELTRLEMELDYPRWRVECRSDKENLALARNGLETLDNKELAEMALSASDVAELSEAVFATLSDGTAHLSFPRALPDIEQVHDDRYEGEFDMERFRRVLGETYGFSDEGGNNN